MIKKFLIFVEDPGALNMVIDLPEFFDDRNIQFDIVANNYASEILSHRKVNHISLLNKDQVEDFIKGKSYNAFLIGTSENIESMGLYLIELAKKRKIKTIGLVDMFVNASSRFKGNSNNRIKYKPDFLIVTDLLTKEAFSDLGMNSENIFICNHPQKQRIKSLKNEFEKKYFKKETSTNRWLFISENIDLFNPSDSYRSIDYTFLGRGTTSWRTGIILEEIIDMLKIISPLSKLEVRLHPKNNLNQFKKWEDEISFDNIIDPMESVWKADYVLGMSSNLLIEAAYLGKNVLSILPRYQEKEWINELKNNFIPSVFTRDKLKEKLEVLQSNKKQLNNIILEKSFNEGINHNLNELIITL